MITVFTRKELLITRDTKRQADVRDILAANGIDYTVKVTNRESPAAIGSSRARAGSFGIRPDSVYEYRLYVHKKDYDRALSLLR